MINENETIIPLKVPIEIDKYFCELSKKVNAPKNDLIIDILEFAIEYFENEDN